MCCRTEVCFNVKASIVWRGSYSSRLFFFPLLHFFTVSGVSVIVSLLFGNLMASFICIAHLVGSVQLTTVKLLCWIQVNLPSSADPHSSGTSLLTPSFPVATFFSILLQQNLIQAFLKALSDSLPYTLAALQSHSMSSSVSIYTLGKT